MHSCMRTLKGESFLNFLLQDPKELYDLAMYDFTLNIVRFHAAMGSCDIFVYPENREISSPHGISRRSG
jgi:hypothetical protein